MATRTLTETIPGLAELKQATRATWAAGDYRAVARRQLWPVGARVVRRIGVGKGEDVLDVACGTGNAAIRAAQAGGRVVGADLTPELFEAGRRLAEEAGVEVRWVEGDAEDLPFDDGSFDVVLSVFGCIFAPRHEVAARELARVLRPGGRMALTAWTLEGVMGEFFRTVGDYMPRPPQFAAPPPMWGSEAHVRKLFEGTGVQIEFERDTIEFEPFESTQQATEFLTTKFGPVMMARKVLEPQGRWDEFLRKVREMYERNEPAEYLLILGSRP